jgi:NTP pyrophosphatase (non-canonical NTP hydrolase)
MNLKEHKRESERTFQAPENSNHKQLSILHCVIGASTETGELLDQLKKHVYYNKPIDVVNVKEELGDIMWYLSNLARLMNFDIEECLELNIKKLRTRYPDKYSDNDALDRNLDLERKALEE